jgi:hypothetical protein
MEERRDDWRHGVDENLASLNAGQRVWERELVTIRRLLSDIDKFMRGDPDKDTDGVIGRLHSQETEIRRINAVIFKDATGKGGLLEDVKEIKGGREDRRLGWANITKIAVALIMAGLVGRFYGDLIHLVHPAQKHAKHAKIKRQPPQELEEISEGQD